MTSPHTLASEILVPLEHFDGPDAGRELGELLAAQFAVPSRTVHIDIDSMAGDGSEDVSDRLVAEILGCLTPGSLPVMHSDHANRWNAKASVAEHVVDQWPRGAIVIGPKAVPPFDLTRPLLVAVDGSKHAERSVVTARGLAETLGAEIVLARVVGHPLGDDDRTAEAAAADYLEAAVATWEADDVSVPMSSCVLTSNDPVSALAAEASRRGCGLIVLASRGDRATQRSSMSRTGSGLIGEATQPVVIVGPEW